MRAATEGHLQPVMPQGNLVEFLDREVRRGSPGELMVESSPSRQRRPSCKTSKAMSDEAADAAALSYLPTYLLLPLVDRSTPLYITGISDQDYLALRAGYSQAVEGGNFLLQLLERLLFSGSPPPVSRILD